MKRLLLVIAWALLASGCPQNSESDFVRLGVDESLQELRLGEYLVAAYQEENKKRARLIYSPVDKLQAQALAGELDLVIVVSEATLEAFDKQGIASRVKTLAHEGLIFIGPYRDYLGRHAQGTGVEVLMAVARSNHRYYKAALGSAERARHDRFFKQSGDAFEPGAFFESKQSGLEHTRRVIEGNGFGLVRRSSLLLGAQEKLLPHRIYRAGEEDLVLRLVAVEVHAAMTKRPARPELFDYLVSDDGQKLLSSYGRERFGVPVYAPGANEPGKGATVPLPKTAPAPKRDVNNTLGGFPDDDRAAASQPAKVKSPPESVVPLQNKVPKSAASQPKAPAHQPPKTPASQPQGK